MVQHAIASADKHARRESILQAASQLFLAGDGTLPSAAQIAIEAGLAKGTVYLYFRTKEEIFIALLIKDLENLLSVVATTFQQTKGRRTNKLLAFFAIYVDYLHQHPELLRLDALGYGVLEKNLERSKLHQFKTAFASSLIEAGRVLEESLKLPPGRGSSLLMRTFALTRGLWQSSHPCEAITGAESESTFNLIYPDFDKELTEALTEYWRGALA